MARRFSFLALSLAAALLNCATVGVPVSWGADYKLGYIDSERIFNEYTGTKSLQTDFQNDLEGWSRQVESLKAELDKLTREYDSQKLMLSETRRKEKEDELLAKQGEYEQLNRDIYGPTGKVATKNQQISKTIVTAIKAAVEKIAADGGYSIIFDAADGNLVYGDANLDLTDQVIQALNITNPNQTNQH